MYVCEVEKKEILMLFSYSLLKKIKVRRNYLIKFSLTVKKHNIKLIDLKIWIIYTYIYIYIYKW